MKWTSILGLLLGFAHGTLSLSVAGDRLLVVLDELDDKSKYSTLLADLESRGFNVEVSLPNGDKSSLFKYGEKQYDHLMLFPLQPKSYSPNFTPESVIEFVEKEGNVMLGLSGAGSTSLQLSTLLSQFDIHLPSYRTAVTVDHFHYDHLSSPEKHDVLVLPRPDPLRNDTRNFFGGEGVLAVPRAVGHILGADSPFVSPVLRAPETAYTYNPNAKAATVQDAFAAGSQTGLVSAVQARNSARFTVVGSSEMLEDEWFAAQVKTGADKGQVHTVNREFARQLTSWTFKESGVLRSVAVNHWLLSDQTDSDSISSSSVPAEKLNPEGYRIKSDVAFEVDIAEWVGDQWVPFVPPENDEVQLDFTMLSPFYRVDLTRTEDGSGSGASRFMSTFKTPHQHGIYHFRVDYRRPFLTAVDERRQVSLRHFAHNEWARSWTIPGAWPWVAGLWCTVAGFLVFTFAWLYSSPPAGLEQTKKAGKTE